MRQTFFVGVFLYNVFAFSLQPMSETENDCKMGVNQQEMCLAWRLVGMNFSIKVHIFREGHKILRNLHQLFDSFDWQYIKQKIGGDFAKFWGFLRIYEL